MLFVQYLLLPYKPAQNILYINVPQLSMADLGPIVQVKEKPSVSYRDKLCDKKSIMTKVGANWECKCCPYLKMPAFTCNRDNGCEEREGYYSRCKPCNRKYMTWKRCKKWKKLLKRSKQHKSLKFITLTIKNPITFSKKDPKEYKHMIMKPWNKLLPKIEKSWRNSYQ